MPHDHVSASTGPTRGPTKTTMEKPKNGFAGLKHWRQDVLAGLLVSLISLPLSLGIAVASGAPPIAGLTSAIIAGLIMPFLGGSFVTISGPAAGLAPVLLAAMTALGKGSLDRGYPLLLGVIAIVGCVQIALSVLRAARFSAIFPSAVVEGMLASIGLMIIAKQLPHFIGHPYKAHEFFEYILETPRELPFLNPRVFGLGLTCLGLLFFLGSKKWKWARAVPPQLTVVVVGIMLGMVLGINGKALINIPDNVLKHGFVLPNFQGLFYDRTLWSVMAVAIVTLTMVDGVESLATAQAVDKIDPFHRKSSPNRVLMAMGVLNIASSLGGGLTIIPGGVKSKACIVGGGRTLWANFYNACFLLCFLFIARPVINLIPYAALAAILIYTGYKMCEPKIWRHIKGIGWEQLALFTITVVATLLSDLLIGIIVGVASKLLLNLAFMVRGMPFSQIIPRVPGLAMGLFRSPVRSTISVDADTVKLVFDGPLVCFNTLQVNRALGLIPKNTHHLYLEFKEHVSMIDHTSCENLVNFGEEFENSGRGDVHFEGMDLLTRLSPHETCTRIRRINLNAPLPKPALVPFDGFQIDPISPIAVSEALQDSALETALVRESERENEWPVHAGHPNAAMIRLGMVPVGRFLKNPDGELSTFGLLEAAPARKAFKEEPIYPFI